jgi:hypothetical protein
MVPIGRRAACFAASNAELKLSVSSAVCIAVDPPRSGIDCGHNPSQQKMASPPRRLLISVDNSDSSEAAVEWTMKNM